MHLYIDLRHSFLQYFLQGFMNKNELELRTEWNSRKCFQLNCKDNSSQLYLKDDFFPIFQGDGFQTRHDLSMLFKQIMKKHGHNIERMPFIQMFIDA
jgi:hypothetical protein